MRSRRGSKALPPVCREACSKVVDHIAIKLALKLKQEKALVFWSDLDLFVGCFEVKASTYPHAVRV